MLIITLKAVLMKTFSIPITVLFTLFMFHSFATTYTFNGPGSWDDATLWSPSYPGADINAADEVIINDECIVSIAVQNMGTFNILGSLIVEGPFIFVNSNGGNLSVDGELIVDHIMYNQGLLIIENSLTINHLLINFSDMVNNGTVISLGEDLNSTGTFVNNGTFIDEAGFFEQGSSDHQGVWEGTASYSNGDFIGNGSTISPAGTSQIGEYSFFSNLVANNILFIEIDGTGGAGIGNDKVICFDEASVDDFSLEVSLTNGFEPQAGDSFEILSANNGIIGDLSDPYGNLPSLNAGLIWVYENDGSTINLSVESTVAVDLSPLIAREKNKSVYLSWSSYSEINHDFYSLERSSNASTWSEIGRLAGAGQSHVTLDYEYIDETPLIGDNYYRIKSVDIDGIIEISDLTHIAIDRSIEPRVWPLIFRADDPISINIDEFSEGDYLIKVYNQFGQKVYANICYLDGFRIIDVNASLSSGKYFIMFEKDSLIINKSFLVH